MTTVTRDIKNSHPFWQDYNNRLRTVYAKGHLISRMDHAQYIEEWYGYDAKVRSTVQTKKGTKTYTTFVWLTMTKHEHTIFMLKYDS